MFDVDQKPTFIETVTVKVPNGLSFLEQTFQGLFEAIDLPELEGFDLSKPDDTRRFCERVLVGGNELFSGKKPIEFGDKVKASLIAKSWVRTGIVDAYVAGVQRAARGN